MIEALERYLVHAARTEDHLASVVTALESVAQRPWDVIRLGTFLSRSTLAYAEQDLGITRTLQATTPGGKYAVLTVAAGQPYPMLDHVARRARAVVDPPLDLARRVVASALASVDGPVYTALDPACGTGAFLLALQEAGVPEIYGTDLDEVALAVAQIAVPEARLLQESPIRHGPLVDVLVGSPPFVPPEHQDAALRRELGRRYPWLGNRFDLGVPFACAGAERVRPGGAVGFVLPSSMLVAPYAAPMRQRWLRRHRIAEVSGPHHHGDTDVTLLVMGIGQTPAPLPVYGIEPTELLDLRNAPINPDCMPGDVELIGRIRAASVDLERVAELLTGLIVQGPSAGQERLIYEEDAEGRVPYADAKDFFSRRLGFLDYQPEQIHKPMRPEDFQQPKIVVQIARGMGAIRAAIDWDGVFLDHSCAMVVPKPTSLPLERLLELFRSPLVDAVIRVEQGRRVDLHLQALARFPVPRAWLEDDHVSLEQAWGLSRDDVERLQNIAR